MRSNYLISDYSRDVELREMLDETISSWTRERPDLDLDAMATVLRLNALVTVGSRLIESILASHQISLGEFDVLAALRRNGSGAELTPTTLARVAMLSPSGMTNRLDRLVAAGFITRRADPADRRGSLISLTRSGETVTNLAVKDVAAAESELFGRISATERLRFDRTLNKLLDQLTAAATAAGTVATG